MKPRLRLVRSSLLLSFLCLVAAAASAESSFSVSGRYTAQRKPRITVRGFENTNSMAQSASYGSSVEAMLVTFFKRKSQFVVVERQKLGAILEEWQRNQSGLTNLKSGDPGARELLEKIDGIVIGNVTLLNATAEATTAGKEGAQRRDPEVIRDQRIEIDAKLLSRSDGRIIAAAQRSGPVRCLRSIVERLGVALEHEFLRPYYGSLRFKYSDPENVRVFLTPILLDTALDEEKPPVERSATVVIGADQDRVEPWATDPTTYTINNVLSGLYSLRLERPGYEGVGTENARWETREEGGRNVVYDRTNGQPIERTDRQQARFVVSVDPLTTETIDGDALGFSFRKLGGSIDVWVRREYVDADFAPSSGVRVTLLGDQKMEINQTGAPGEQADDQACDLINEITPPLAHPGVTRVASGQVFDFDTFKGGGLIFDDYHGETLPAGSYQMELREPHYEVGVTEVTVRDQDRKKPVRHSLLREAAPLVVTVTGERTGAVLRIEGRVTHRTDKLSLDTARPESVMLLPVDEYTVQTDIPGLGKWQRHVDLLSGTSLAPGIEATSAAPPKPASAPTRASEALRQAILARSKHDARLPTLRVKTGLSVGGRVQILGASLDPKKDDVYVDRGVERMLDALIGRPWVDEQPAQPLLLGQVGRSLTSGLVPQTAEATLPNSPGPNTDPAAPPGRAPALSSTLGARPASESRKNAEASPEGPDAVDAEEDLPKDRDELLERLTERLQEIDLLVLHEQDLGTLLRSAPLTSGQPDVAAALRAYVERGGALFVFLSEPGDYQKVLGVPIVLEDKPKKSDRFELAAGDVAGVRLGTVAKLKLSSKRRLPKIDKNSLGAEWRVLAYTQDRKDPRIVERGARDRGGYVMVWCDESGSLRGRKYADADALRTARSDVAMRAVAWARYLMYRRYDATGEELRRAEQALDRPRSVR